MLLRGSCSLSLVVLVSLVGCASSRRPLSMVDTGSPPPSDTGTPPRDAGAGIDAAFGNDAYTPPRNDAYVARVDAWSPPQPDAWSPPPVDAWSGGSCSLTFTMTTFTSLSPGCFTRCQRATLTAYNACPATNSTCQNNALNADPTASIAFDINGMPANGPLTCAQCFSLQELHCAFDNGCPSQTYAFAICNPMTTSCTSQTNALNSCWTRNQTAIGACINDATMGAIACFGP